MSDKPSRFSQAQILIAALFAVVLTGDMPEDSPLPITPQMTPLEEEFTDIFSVLRHVRSRLTRASIFWFPQVETHPYYGRSHAICLGLTRLQMMPSAVATAVEGELGRPYNIDTLGRPCNDDINHRHVSPRERCLIAGVARMYGIDSAIINRCCERPEEMDKAWHRCRAELLKIRAERQAVQR